MNYMNMCKKGLTFFPLGIVNIQIVQSGLYDSILTNPLCFHNNGHRQINKLAQHTFPPKI